MLKLQLLKLLSAAALSAAIVASPLAASAASQPLAPLQAPQLGGCYGHWGQDPGCPIRVSFRRGAYSATVYSSLSIAADQRYYVVRARAGQVMRVWFWGDGDMRGGVIFPSGGGEGPIYGHGESIVLPESGDTIVYAGQNTMAGGPWGGPIGVKIQIK